MAGMERLLTRSYTEDVRWPFYDRRLHDVVQGGDLVTAHNVLLEGNWLLLDEEPWSDLRRHAERTIFIEASSDLLQQRLVSRKVAGGLSRADAEAFYLRSDGPNIERTLSGSDLDSVDLLLTMDVNGSLHERKAS